MPTKIEWANEVWNPVVGCTPASAGCDHCYARAMFNRNLVIHTHKFENPSTYPNRLDIPFHWKNPRRVFVNSMSDLFHPDVPFSFIDDVFSVMTGNNRHTFMVLTKRPKRMIEFLKQHYLPGAKADNIWLGVSVEDQETADQRIPQLLLATVAAVRFVSVEPMLGPVELRKIKGDFVNFNVLDKSRFDYGIDGFGVGAPMSIGIDWVVCGGETGPRARPVHPDWIRSLQDQCVKANIPFFFKQWGEWLPISEMKESEWDKLYKPQSKIYPESKRDCKVKNVGIRFDGEIDNWESIEGKPTFLTFKIGKKKGGRKLDGREWNQFPEVKQCIKN
jgi:protein gp37